MPDRPVSYVGGVSLHTLPDMTPEPTADEIREWLRQQEGIRPGRFAIARVLEARDALIAEREAPPQFVPHVLLPADWAVYYTWTVTVTANDPEAMGAMTARQLADTIDQFLAPMRCTQPAGIPQPGMHCAACCMGTGWADVQNQAELDASRALDRAVTLLRAIPGIGPAPTGDDQPHPIDLTRELREALGLFSGAMPCTPKEAWGEAIEAVKALRSGWCWKCMEKDSNLADSAPTGDDQ